MDVLREPFFVVMITLITLGGGGALIGCLMTGGVLWRGEPSAPAWFDKAVAVFAIVLIIVGLLYAGWTTT